MPRLQPEALPLPRWLMFVGSVLIAAHLVAIGGLALAAPSGPWSTPFGESTAMPPQFAQEINKVSIPYYLRPLHMTHNYHFFSNQLGLPAVFLEFRLKDDSGNVTQTLKLPDDRANFWLRHRQLMLARGLGDDVPVRAPPGEVIAAPRQSPPSVDIWEPAEGRLFKIKTIPEHLIPRDRDHVYGPNDWARLLARSYGRYLCRTHGAASVEVIRHSKDVILPVVLLPVFEDGPPGGQEEMIASFGEVKR